MMKKMFFLLAIPIFVLFACNEDEKVFITYEEQLTIDIEKIKNYLSENELVADSTESGLFYIIDEEGTGSYPTLDSIVEVQYTGKYLNEQVFDSGTIEYRLDGLILGWQEGMLFFKEGGKGILLIPSGLGYGSTARSNIPANSVLIFNIDLINVAN